MSVGSQIRNGILGFLIVCPSLFDALARADELYAAPSVDDVRSRSLEWAARQKIADRTSTVAIGTLWAETEAGIPPRELFSNVINTFRLADIETRRFLSACRLRGAPLVPPDAGIIATRGDDDPFYSDNMKLFYGRYLARRRMYDEAWTIFEELDPNSVIDPATCLFWKAVCQHQLLMKEEALATLKTLLENTERVPISYSSAASLMQYELERLRQKTLEEISRQMQDSGRRLELARGGQRVQKVQDEIVAGLDELIEKLEQQSGGGGGGGGSGQNRSNQSSSPAQDSQIKGSTAPGEVDKKKFRKQGAWGALPPKQAAAAKNMINQNFPAHYRKAVEEYFKKLANRRAASDP